VIALSLGGEFAALAALQDPDLFHSLVLISPTGLAQKGRQHPEENGVDDRDFAYTILTFPLWSQAIFDLLVTRPSIHYFLQKSFHGPVDQGLESYSYLSAHQPGARHAPLYFLDGKLFTPNVRQDVYEQVSVPGLILYDEDAYTGFDGLPDLLLARPSWSAVRITPTRGLPHFEQLETTIRVLDNFWESVE
jgi:pimeloyl-ACP methyl ester carboxylesterase